MQGILLYQIEALDGGTLPPAEILPLLNILKSAATGVFRPRWSCATCESCYPWRASINEF
ncbi:MAG: hypothetical protein IPJ38_21235 [Dechloromonas sp.]|uniref:Uncharacterized protein n=1 Tax=Candidatus Dechloromonas phosphorivorans TaxID=2899244 RepID=A0A935MSL2_9RHOO|nr:hypothetical protein [Candidatus Dechloromonas phosphorivorans]